MISITAQKISPDQMIEFDSHRFYRLLEGGLPREGFSFLDPSLPPAPANSANIDLSAVSELIGADNPHLPVPSPEALYVIAGQQAGLLTGPLYTFLKAVSVITLARELTERSGQMVLPLFWIASEDHDILEVNRVVIRGEKFVVPPPSPLTRGQMPQVGDISLTESKAPLLAFLGKQLPPTEFTEWVRDHVAAADFTNYATAFQSLLSPLFEQWKLRFVNPASLRSLTGPVLANLVELWPGVIEALLAGGARLEKIGFTAPLSGARIYELQGGCRVPVDLDEQGGLISTGRRSLSEIAAEIRARPADFSPSAALRPICQDGALPSAATIGGPTELLYLWQIESCYDLIHLAPSPRFSRRSATFVSDSDERRAAKSGLIGPQLFSLPALMRNAAAKKDSSSSDNPELQMIEKLGDALLGGIDQITPVDPPRYLRSGRSSIDKGITRIVSGLRQDHLSERGLDLARLQKLEQILCPNGRLQERNLNIFQLLNQHGPEFIGSVIGALDPLAARHQLVTISSREE